MKLPLVLVLLLTAVVGLVWATGVTRTPRADVAEPPASAGAGAPADPDPAQARDVRSGPVRIEGGGFADDDGAWNPLGVSLFWALWGEKFDPDRLDRNLAHVAAHNVDYIRMLGMVGTPSWSDRVIDPGWADYWDVVDRLFERLARHELRAQVTIFADAQVMMPETSDRETFAAAWAERANESRDRVLLIEVANEGWQNGFPDPAALRNLGDRLLDLTSIPLALSAPQESTVFDLYAGWPEVATLHYERDISRAGPWLPVWQPWGWPDAFRERAGHAGPIPAVAVNNEPIGPHASVAEDFDALRLALSYVTTFVAGNGAYVYHSGAGIRGGGEADIERGRHANIFDYDHGIIRAIGAMRRQLPAGLANWTRHDPSSPAMPWDGIAQAIERGDLARAYAATSGDHFVAVLLDVRRAHDLVARLAMDVALVDPTTGEERTRTSLSAGEAWTVPADLPGYVVIGRGR